MDGSAENYKVPEALGLQDGPGTALNPGIYLFRWYFSLKLLGRGEKKYEFQAKVRPAAGCCLLTAPLLGAGPLGPVV